MQIHVDRGGERFGPYSLEEVNTYLANGTLLPTDQAWSDGMVDWVPIGQIPGVTMAGDSAAQQISPSPSPSAANAGNKKLLIGIGAGVGVLVVMAGIWFFLIREDGSNPQNVDAQKPNLAKTETKVGGKKPGPTKAVSNKLIADPLVEKAIRFYIKKPKGELAEADLQKVVRLNFYRHKITDAGLKEVTKLTQLKSLQLADCTQITDVGLKGIGKLQQLTYLRLGGTQTTDEVLKEVGKLQHLRMLFLHNTEITDAGLKELAKLEKLTNLALYGTQITDIGLKEVVKFQQLKELNLGHTQITDASLKELARLTQLKTLFLSDPKVTKAGVAQLQNALLKCKIHLILEAGATPIGKQKAVIEWHIRKSLNKPTGELTRADLDMVTELNLVWARITDEGLKEVVKLTQLRKLILDNNQITDAGLKEVAKLRKLSVLSVGGTQVTKAGVAELRRMFPNAVILSDARK